MLRLLTLTAMTIGALAAQPSSHAQQLGLKQTWTAPMDATPGGDVAQFLSENWGVRNHDFYGNTDMSFTKTDPVGGNGSGSVIEVQYKAGSYAANTEVLGGCEFNAYPFSGAFDSALLSYEIAFKDNFDWVQGGKLPGIFGGDGNAKCSGGDQANGNNCFSVRLMWRQDGKGEAYGYIPDHSICNSDKSVVCNDGYGVSFSRGAIQFKPGQWTKMEIYVKLNDAGQSNGKLQVWQDGSLVIDKSTLKYRTTNQLGITSLMFSTFFGGGSKAYATPVDTSTYYKDIEFSVGNAI